MKKEIIRWSNENWPHRSELDVTLKLQEELQELLEAIEKNDEINIAEELFDVYAMIIDYAYTHNIKLRRVFAAKRAIVNLRKKAGKQPTVEREILGAYL